MGYRQKSVLMESAEISQTLSRIADEIREHGSITELAVVGIRTRGAPLAQRLAALIGSRSGTHVPVGVLDITLYRDDVEDIGSQPVVRPTVLPFPVNGRRIVLVDDVIYTGRTVRAAIDELIDFGRPKRIELVVLIDRGSRELPIMPNYVGKRIEASSRQLVNVLVSEEDGGDRVVLMEEED